MNGILKKFADTKKIDFQATSHDNNTNNFHSKPLQASFVLDRQAVIGFAPDNLLALRLAEGKSNLQNSFLKSSPAMEDNRKFLVEAAVLCDIIIQRFYKGGGRYELER